jgi:predicted amidophosphoribosyltransferase
MVNCDYLSIWEYSWKLNQNSGDLLLMCNGSSVICAVLSKALSLSYGNRFDDYNGEYDWGVYFKGINQDYPDDELDLIDNFLQYLCQFSEDIELVVINDSLDFSFSLSPHTIRWDTGECTRSLIGQLVYEAKSYNNYSGDIDLAYQLAEFMSDFIQTHPAYLTTDLLVAVPPSNSHKLFDLPSELVDYIAYHSNKTNASKYLKKNRSTRPMKECESIQEKQDNIKDAFQADDTFFQGKKVIIIDDIYHTGTTIQEVAKTLKKAGAKLVLGLTATKTFRN